MIIWIMLVFIAVLYIFVLFKKKRRKDIISVYFGVPGSGKTTFASYLAKKDLKKGGKVWSNVPITGTYQLDCKADLGKHMIVDGRIIIDEAGIEYNNRNYKQLDQESIKFFKYHRHYECGIDVFSQSHEDMDVTIRRLAQVYYCVRKSRIFPNVIVCKAIGRRIGIDEKTKQIIDEYYWKPFSTKRIWSRPLWKLFNTTSREELPEKDWKLW